MTTRWVDLNPETRASIELQPLEREWSLIRVCGCHHCRDLARLWPCEYHIGFDDGFDDGVAAAQKERTVSTAYPAWGELHARQ